MGQLDIATQALKTAEAQGIDDWKTLSAQGTLRAKQAQYAEAEQYFLAALQKEPNAISVTNNLALAYALDGKADKAEELLRKAVASGQGDKRVRQNLALVLGIEGKYDEARQIASVDMGEQEAKANVTYLRNMLTSPNAFASAKPDDNAALASSQDDDGWQPYDTSASEVAPVRAAAATPPSPPKVQVVKPVDEIEAPAAASAPGAQPAAKVASAAQAVPAKTSPAPKATVPDAAAQGLLKPNLD